MISIILRTATKFLITLLLLFSVFLLLRGHNEPGGGFVGGLVAASAYTLHALAYDVASTRSALRFEPRMFIGIGLVTAALSGLLPLLFGRPFLTGLWADIELPGGGVLDLGTPLLFDVGVYLGVVGVVLTIILSLAEE
jgi:multicomponent Na+:H+ antiporter subunit B